MSFFFRTHLIVAPLTIRAEQEYNIHVTVFIKVNVRAAIQKNGEEYASTEEPFETGSSRLLALKVS